MDQFIDGLDSWKVDRERDAIQPGDVNLAYTRAAEASPSWQRILDTLTHRARRRRTIN